MEGHIGDQRSKAVMRYLDRLKKSVRRGASLSLANAPKLHLGILEGLNHAIEVRGQDGAVIEIAQFGAHRHAGGEARDVQAWPFQHIGEVMRRGLTVDRGRQRQDHFAYAFIPRASHQTVHAQIFGPDAIQRRE